MALKDRAIANLSIGLFSNSEEGSKADRKRGSGAVAKSPITLAERLACPPTTPGSVEFRFTGPSSTVEVLTPVGKYCPNKAESLNMKNPVHNGNSRRRKFGSLNLESAGSGSNNSKAPNPESAGMSLTDHEATQWRKIRRQAEFEMHLDVYACGSTNVNRIA